METLRQRLAEQKGRHQGGSKWIGTGGTSPFGAYGDHPEGVRIGQDKGRRGERGKSVGQARVQGFRRRRGARAAQHPHRAPAPAPLCARRRRGRARPRRHHPLDRRQGLYRREAAPRAPQRGQGAAIPRRRRLDGLARAGGRGAVLRRAPAVQAARAFLFPQLSLRKRVARQSPPLRGAHADGRSSSTPTAATTASSSSATPR